MNTWLYRTLAALGASAAGFAAFALGGTSSAASWVHHRWVDHGGWNFAQSGKKGVNLSLLPSVQGLTLYHVPGSKTKKAQLHRISFTKVTLSQFLLQCINQKTNILLPQLVDFSLEVLIFKLRVIVAAEVGADRVVEAPGTLGWTVAHGWMGLRCWLGFWGL